ncbi:hypothetical protein IPJ72_05900 [Candidatus Peregrinibacteria bacterium]|nr:MAG: hypothetical protein IPJ72_05900 [Candidatus Peregrinibacteria bacterium]
MKPIRIITATVLLLIVTTVLGGCTPRSSAPSSSQSQAELNALLEKALAVKKEAELTLKGNRNGDQLTVDVYINNPTQKGITSVQSWLSFDPKKLEGQAIETADSDFELLAPYGAEFDTEAGLVRIGRSSAVPVTKSMIKVATVRFTIQDTGTTAIDFYDYRDDLKGHSSVDTIVENVPYNILLTPKSPALVIEN